MEIFKKLVREGKNDELARLSKYQIAWVLYQMGKDKEAINEFTNYIAEYRQSEITPDTVFWLGQYYYEQREWDAALKYFAEVSQTYPTHPLSAQADYWSAWAIKEKNDIPLAVEKLKSICAKYPQSVISAEASYQIGNFLYEIGKSEEGLDYFNQTILNYPNTDFKRLSYKRTGEILASQDEFQKAGEAFRQALNENRDSLNAEIQFELAACVQKIGDIEKALNEYLKVGYLYPQAKEWVEKAQAEINKLDK